MNKSLSEICNELSGRVSNPPSEPVRLSSWENCPLCDSTFIEVHEDPIYKPEVVCTDCGITLQGETVFAIKERWNKRRNGSEVYNSHNLDRIRFLPKR